MADCEKMVLQIEAILPPTYYAHLTLPERVMRLANDWAHAISVNKELQAQRDFYYDALSDLKEYRVLMKTRIDQVDAPPTGGKE
jgi:hypothetical protein